jgi:hypothetical protein
MSIDVATSFGFTLMAHDVGQKEMDYGADGPLTEAMSDMEMNVTMMSSR